MIYGIGTDISLVSRFEKWVSNPDMIKRFFNPSEIMENGSLSAKCQHYAARFAAKEAFSKALGTGLVYNIKDSFIVNNDDGKPELVLQDSAKLLFEKQCGNFENFHLHVSLSHEKEYATAFVIIEKIK